MVDRSVSVSFVKGYKISLVQLLKLIEKKSFTLNDLKRQEEAKKYFEETKNEITQESFETKLSDLRYEDCMEKYGMCEIKIKHETYAISPLWREPSEYIVGKTIVSTFHDPDYQDDKPLYEEINKRNYHEYPFESFWPLRSALKIPETQDPKIYAIWSFP